MPGVVHHAPAAVRFGDRVDDREPEPDSSGRAGARGVGSGKALEDPNIPRELSGYRGPLRRAIDAGA